MTPKNLDFFTDISDVKQLQQMVPWGCEHPISISVPLQVHDSMFVSMSCEYRKLLKTYKI